jgi:hypothetical protein
VRAARAWPCLLLVAGCPTPRPLLPELPAGETGTGGSSTSGGTAASSSSSGSTTGDAASTTTETIDGSDSSSSTTGSEVCEPPEGGCMPGPEPWWDEAWDHRRRLEIEVPAGVDASLTDAVVPVRLDATLDWACLRDDGGDLRFVTDEGVLLAHELDEWQPGQAALIWVRLPALDSSWTSPWLYYGNAAAEAEPAEVWPQALGYLDDATGQHHGQPAEGLDPTYFEDGVLGRAVHYESILLESRTELMGSEEIDAAMAASESFTVTAWLRATPDVAAPTPFRAVVTRGSAHWSMSIRDPTVNEYDFFPPVYMLFSSDCVDPACDPIVDAFDNHFLDGTVPIIEDAVVAVWHHAAIVYEPAGGGNFHKRLYVDGELDTELTAFLPILWDSLEVEPITIGAGPVTPDQFAFHGEIDEVRIASQAWDAERIRAEHVYAAEPGLVTVQEAECR